MIVIALIACAERSSEATETAGPPTDSEPEDSEPEDSEPIDTVPVDDDGDGWTDLGGDCDDGDAARHPHAGEVPHDGVDQDCDGADVCVDLNCDGWPDVVFSNTQGDDGRYESATSTVVWGGPAGPDPSATTSLPAIGGMGVAAGDPNGDGYVDLVVVTVEAFGDRHADSTVFWGGPDGPDPGRVTLLPTVGAADATVGDLDGDGYDDVVVCNRYNGGSALDPSSYTVDSAVFWGGPDGVSPERSLYLPTMGAARARLADVDADGLMDVVFASGTFHTADSYVYLGATGWDVAGRVVLEGAAPEGLAVGDLDGDGWPEVVLANFYEALVPDIDSYVYWGGASGFSGVREKIATHGATGADIADLDKDGWPDLVLANSLTGSLFDADFAVDSTVHAGGPDGPDEAPAFGLPTTSASAVAIGDVDLDGWPDVAFSNYYDADGRPRTDSYIYLGSASGFDVSRVIRVPTMAGSGVALVGAPR
jgi:hypothetical protein